MKLEQGKFYKRSHWVNTCFCYREFDHSPMFRHGERIKGAATLNTETCASLVACDLYANPLPTGFPNNFNQPEKMKMNKDYLGTNYDVVKCNHVSVENEPVGQLYIFKADKSLELKEGDQVVVDTTRGLSICTVHSLVAQLPINVRDLSAAKAWVACKLDLDLHKQRIEATEQRAYLLKKMEEAKAAADVTEVYRALAANNPEMAALVKQLDDIKVS